MSQWINVHWWPSCNYGDYLSPYIIEKMSGKRPVWTDINSNINKYLTTGTIITGHMPSCVVWGSGIMHEDGVPGKADYNLDGAKAPGFSHGDEAPPRPLIISNDHV